MTIPQSISQRRLAQLLGISERAVRKRGGTTLPAPQKGQYRVAAVLWKLGEEERRRVADGLQINVDYLQMMFICSIHPKTKEHDDGRSTVQ